MGRPKATISNLLTETGKPVSGQAFVILHLATGEVHRVRCPAHRDIAKNEALKPLMRFSGPDQFFKVTFFRDLNTVLKFPCGPDVTDLVDTTGTYRWLGKSLKAARAEGITLMGDVGGEKSVISHSVSDEVEKEISAVTEETGFVEVSDLQGVQEEATGV